MKRKKKLAITFILVVFVLYLSVLLVDYIYTFGMAKKPLFAIEADKNQVVNCKEYKFEGLGYNYFMKECYNQDNNKYEMHYVKLTIFDHDVRQGVYNLTI